MITFEQVLEYNDWARRGYLEPINCPIHANLDLIPDADKDGLILVCGLCDYIKHIGAQGEKDILSKIRMAKFLFTQEA